MIIFICALHRGLTRQKVDGRLARCQFLDSVFPLDVPCPHRVRFYPRCTEQQEIANGANEEEEAF